MNQNQWDDLLDKSPNDNDLRRAYATWLQDEQDDQDRADFQRWLADNDKAPTNKPINQDEKGWRWYWSHPPITEPCKNATLPVWALKYLRVPFWIFETRKEAEEAAFCGWKKWQDKESKKK